jgi:hypothetical protein
MKHSSYQFTPLSAASPTPWRYHVVIAAMVLIWSVGAWSLRRLYDVYPQHALPLHYLWATMEVVLVTVLVVATAILFHDGAKTPLALVFLALTAGSVLRFRSDLVNYVTAACLTGYVVHFVSGSVIGWQQERPLPEHLTSWHEAVIFSLSLLMIGFVQYMALKRSRRAALTSSTHPSGSRNA